MFNKWLKIIGIVLVWKLVLIGVVLIAGQWLEYRPDFDYTRLTQQEQKQLVGGEAKWLAPWTNFDGVHYLHIAQRGYVDEARFFPLYPLLINLVSPDPQWGLVTGQILSLIALTGAIVVLDKLIQLDEKKLVSHKTIVALLLFPTAFFLGSLYTESLFLLLIVGSLYSARRGWWVVAGILAWLIMATRLVGIVIVPVLILEWWWQRRQGSKKTKVWHLLQILVATSSLAMYAWFNQVKWGEWLYFISAHTQLANSRSASLVNPLRILWRYGKLLVSLSPKLFEWWVALLEIATLAWVGVVGWGGWKGARPSYVALVLLGIAIPIFSGTLSGFPRYVLVLWPLHMWLAQKLRGWWWQGYLVVSTALLVLLTALFSRGYYVG